MSIPDCQTSKPPQHSLISCGYAGKSSHYACAGAASHSIKPLTSDRLSISEGPEIGTRSKGAHHHSHVDSNSRAPLQAGASAHHRVCAWRCSRWSVRRGGASHISGELLHDVRGVEWERSRACVSTRRLRARLPPCILLDSKSLALVAGSPMRVTPPRPCIRAVLVLLLVENAAVIPRSVHCSQAERCPTNCRVGSTSRCAWAAASSLVTDAPPHLTPRHFHTMSFCDAHDGTRGARRRCVVVWLVRRRDRCDDGGVVSRVLTADAQRHRHYAHSRCGCVLGVRRDARRSAQVRV